MKQLGENNRNQGKYSVIIYIVLMLLSWENQFHPNFAQFSISFKLLANN